MRWYALVEVHRGESTLLEVASADTIDAWPWDGDPLQYWADALDMRNAGTRLVYELLPVLAGLSPRLEFGECLTR